MQNVLISTFISGNTNIQYVQERLLRSKKALQISRNSLTPETTLFKQVQPSDEVNSTSATRSKDFNNQQFSGGDFF